MGAEKCPGWTAYMENEIVRCNERYVMGDYDFCLIVFSFLQCSKYARSVDFIKEHCWLIEKQKSGRPEKRTGQGDALPLAARQSVAAFPHSEIAFVPMAV